MILTVYLHRAGCFECFKCIRIWWSNSESCELEIVSSNDLGNRFTLITHQVEGVGARGYHKQRRHNLVIECQVSNNHVSALPFTHLCPLVKLVAFRIGHQDQRGDNMTTGQVAEEHISSLRLRQQAKEVINSSETTTRNRRLDPAKCRSRSRNLLPFPLFFFG